MTKHLILNTKCQLELFLLFYFEKKDVFSKWNDIKNFGCHLVFSIKFLVIGLKISDEGDELETICNVNFLKKK